jgi:hypothetical protein
MNCTKRLGILGLLLALPVLSASAAIPPLFGGPTSYLVSPGSEPYAVTVGDLNGDGIPDVVTTDVALDMVDVFLGKSDGTFQSPVGYPTGSSPNSVAIGDFNRDGKLDLAVSNGLDSTVSIFLGNGDGTFQSKHDYSAGRTTLSLVTADFNGDGVLDIAVANTFNGGQVLILMGKGDGTFAVAVPYPAGKGPFGLAVGDVNGDGKPDLAVSNFLDNTVSILIGNGDGSFQPPVSYHTAKGPEHVVLADFNGDKKLDMAVLDVSSRKFDLFFNNGDGTFRAGPRSLVGNLPVFLLAADVNGDGAEDLVFSDFASRVDVLFGDGAGNFAAERDYPTDLDDEKLAAADLNHDGRLDLVVAVAQGIDVLLNSGAVADATLSTNTLSFPLQLIGTNSTAQKVTLSNNGDLPLAISSVAASPSFIEQNTCGTSLFIDASCTLNIKFQPQKKGLLSGAVTITDNAPDSPQTIALSGSATSVSLSPTSLNFGNVPVGTTSQPQTVTLTNVSTGPLTIINMKNGNPEFVQTNNCGTGLPGKGSCTITVTLTPTSQGATGDTLKINDSGGASPQTVSLSGTGT